MSPGVPQIERSPIPLPRSREVAHRAAKKPLAEFGYGITSPSLPPQIFDEPVFIYTGTTQYDIYAGFLEDFTPNYSPRNSNVLSLTQAEEWEIYDPNRGHPRHNWCPGGFISTGRGQGRGPTGQVNASFILTTNAVEADSAQKSWWINRIDD
jgi:hypothetical protein